ncbi:Holliday junction branch migration complex subunit RuvA [Dirofilaria immitis]
MISSISHAAKSEHNELSVEIERHFPCPYSTGPSKENTRIRFPSHKSDGVKFTAEENSDGNKCFRMSGGEVEVFPPGLDGSNKYYIHLETKIGINGKPERCINADADGCGGVGSCVYCDICKNMGGTLKNFVQILEKDHLAKCSEDGFAPGKYKDISLRVCLPTKDQLLPFLDQNTERAEQLWNLFVSSRARAGKIPLVITARLFDRPINRLSRKQIAELIRDAKKSLIACHRIYATISQR